MARPVRRAVVILLAAAAVTTVGILVVQDPYTLRLRSAFGADDSRYPPYLAALVGAELTRGNRYDVLNGSDEIFPAMLAAIEAARERISFETYIYDSGAVGDRFTAALERAANRGVRVTMVLDAVGSSSMEADHIDRLERAGCEVIRYNPTRWYAIEDLNYRTHRKILVVDGETGFTGGVGIADHWTGHDEDTGHWRETHVRIHGPIVRLLEASFYENVIETFGPVTPELGDPQKVEGDDASLLVRSTPSGGANELKRLYLLILAGARRTVDITTPYFVPDASTLWALEDAVARGVRIRVLVESDITDAMPVKYASRAVYDRLLTTGIEIYEYQPTMMHAKVLVVDGILSMFGSANFDNRSMELHDELNVAVWSRELAARFTKDFEQDLRATDKLELHTWRRRPLLHKAREQFWSAFGELF